MSVCLSLDVTKKPVSKLRCLIDQIFPLGNMVGTTSHTSPIMLVSQTKFRSMCVYFSQCIYWANMSTVAANKHNIVFGFDKRK